MFTIKCCHVSFLLIAFGQIILLGYLEKWYYNFRFRTPSLPSLLSACRDHSVCYLSMNAVRAYLLLLTALSLHNAIT
jgi:hypothetical protein